MSASKNTSANYGRKKGILGQQSRPQTSDTSNKISPSQFIALKFRSAAQPNQERSQSPNNDGDINFDRLHQPISDFDNVVKKKSSGEINNQKQFSDKTHKSSQKWLRNVSEKKQETSKPIWGTLSTRLSTSISKQSNTNPISRENLRQSLAYAIDTNSTTPPQSQENEGLRETTNIFTEKSNVQVLLSKIIHSNPYARQVPIVKSANSRRSALQNYTSYYNLNVNGNVAQNVSRAQQLEQVQRQFNNIFFPRQFVKLNQANSNPSYTQSNFQCHQENHQKSFGSQSCKWAHNTSFDCKQDYMEEDQQTSQIQYPQNRLSYEQGKQENSIQVNISSGFLDGFSELKGNHRSNEKGKKTGLYVRLAQDNYSTKKYRHKSSSMCQAIGTTNEGFSLLVSDSNQNSPSKLKNSAHKESAGNEGKFDEILKLSQKKETTKTSETQTFSIGISGKKRCVRLRQKSDIDKDQLNGNFTGIRVDAILEKVSNKTYFDPEGDLKRIHAKSSVISNTIRPYSSSNPLKPTNVAQISVDESAGVAKNYEKQQQKLSQSNENSCESSDDEDDGNEEPEIESDEDEREPSEDEDDDNCFQSQSGNNSISNQPVPSSQPVDTQQGPGCYKKLRLLQSVYDNRPATVFFPYPPQCGDIQRDISRTLLASDYEEKRFDMRFKVTTVSLNRCLGHAFQYAGVRETEENDWNIAWGIGCENKVRKMNKFQKLNHFPQWWNMGRKDCLWTNLSRIKRKHPQEYYFIPKTYVLQHQSDWEQFLVKRVDAEKGKLWIMKPSNQSQGKNIKMLSKRTRVVRKDQYIICEYVANPHLINGLKYDLRIYVLVTSYDPLRVYIYEDGLARFATEKYSTSAKELSKRYVHLTNYSLNKHSPNFQPNQDTNREDQGSKWSLQALFKKYIELGIDVDSLWEKIKDIVIKTCISAEPYMTDSHVKCESHRSNCFELYGFDILIDDTLKPWLLEVNVRPSLSAASPLDRRIKHTLVADVFNLIGIIPYDKKKFDEDKKKKIPGVPDSKRNVSKFLNNLSDLNENNCLEKLSPEDWNVLIETDEEFYRKGHFQRIFPPNKDRIDHYMKFFEYERYNNIIIKAWMKGSSNVLEKILKKVSFLSV